MTHPQIDKAWEQVPEFTRDALKIISDQAAQLELKNIDNWYEKHYYDHYAGWIS